MKRWFFILLGGFGLGLSLWSAFMLCLGAPVILGFAAYMLPAEIGLMVAGVVLAVIGFYSGRTVGEYSYKSYSKRGGNQVNGVEVQFRCPSCQKVYRGSPMLAGKPFMCRGCGGQFVVPAASEVRALPAPAA
jgi:hypothetical protein